MAPRIKPTFVVVPGAHHSAWHFSFTTKYLEEAGYRVAALTLPCYGGDIATYQYSDDLKAIRNVLERELERNDVILVMHSFGGFQGTEAVGEVLKSVAGKRKGRLVKLVYVTAFVPKIGGGLMLTGEPELRPLMKDGVLYTHRPIEFFYHDVPLPLAASAVEHLKIMPAQAAGLSVTYEPWRDVPAAYVFCSEDKAIRLSEQEMMVRETGEDRFEKYTLQCSHSPFLSMPDKLAAVLRRCAGEKADGEVKGA